MLIIIIVIVLGTIVYLIARPKVGDRFTEFYALGINGQAADYPTDFTLQNGQVVTVEYGSLSTVFTEQWGRLTLGIVNHEGKDTNYTIAMQIDGLQAGIPFQGNTVDRIGPVTLTPEEKWEQRSASYRNIQEIIRKWKYSFTKMAGLNHIYILVYG